MRPFHRREGVLSRSIGQCSVLPAPVRIRSRLYRSLHSGRLSLRRYRETNSAVFPQQTIWMKPACYSSFLAVGPGKPPGGNRIRIRRTRWFFVQDHRISAHGQTDIPFPLNGILFVPAIVSGRKAGNDLLGGYDLNVVNMALRAECHNVRLGACYSRAVFQGIVSPHRLDAPALMDIVRALKSYQ